MRVVLAAMAVFVLLLAGVQARATEESSPEAIRAELRNLLIRYTNEHPDVQILKRRLELAEAQRRAKMAREAEKKARAGGDAHSGDRPQGPPDAIPAPPTLPAPPAN